MTIIYEDELNGLIKLIPQPSKSLILQITNGKTCTAAVEAMHFDVW